MSETLLQEFSQFVSKYSLHDDQPNIDLQPINKGDFDIVTFFSENFLLNKENSLVNYTKLQEVFGVIHELQGKTLEEIAISVDTNLEKFVDVSKEFEKVKNPLDNTNKTFMKLKKILDENKLKCDTSSKYINELILSKEILEKHEDEINLLKGIRQNFLMLDQLIHFQSEFGFVYIAYLIQKSEENIDNLNKKSQEKVHLLIQKYQINEELQRYKKELLEILKENLKNLLNEMLVKELNNKEEEKLVRLLSSFDLLKEIKQGIAFQK